MMSSLWTTSRRERAHTYAKTDAPHNPHALQSLPILLGDHILVDGVKSDRAVMVVVPFQPEEQDGHAVRGREQDVIVYL